MADVPDNDILEMTTEIVAAFVGRHPNLRAEEIPELIRSVRATLSEDAAPAPSAEPETPSATKSQINKSITPDSLISFIDGKPYKTLKRHLGRHGHDMASYRAAYGLPSDYPSVSPNYSAARSEMAKSLGLGARGRGGSPAAAGAEASAAKPAGAKSRKKAAPES